MFDDIEQKDEIRHLIFLRIRQYKIKYFCKVCKSVIETWWDGDGINGHFIALDTVESELFLEYHADPNRIVCYRCFYNLP